MNVVQAWLIDMVIKGKGAVQYRHSEDGRLIYGDGSIMDDDDDDEDGGANGEGGNDEYNPLATSGGSRDQYKFFPTDDDLEIPSDLDSEFGANHRTSGDFFEKQQQRRRNPGRDPSSNSLLSPEPLSSTSIGGILTSVASKGTSSASSTDVGKHTKR
jgi:hypothetical protein